MSESSLFNILFEMSPYPPHTENIKVICVFRFKQFLHEKLSCFFSSDNILENICKLLSSGNIKYVKIFKEFYNQSNFVVISGKV